MRCPFCGRDVSVRSDGRLRLHAGVGPRALPCPGEGGLPRFRLLEDGETVQQGDEELQEDAATWVATNAAAWGQDFRRGTSLPVRRVR